MAVKWRSLSVKEKEMYEKKVQEADNIPLDVLSLKEKTDIMLRIAKRHQADVGLHIHLSSQFSVQCTFMHCAAI